ncbi:MAG TPA: ketoacyl-ACP synthase III [Roseomonas sp.]|jgi:3-oxoacyl-[acyl-carrier-protein] synthase-3
MVDDQARAELRFTKPAIAGIVTTVGGRQVSFAEEAAGYGLSPAEAARLQTAVGLDRRQVVEAGQTTVDLCLASARHLLDGLGMDPRHVAGLIFVTQTPDHAAPASAMALQAGLGLPVTSMAFDIRMGCSGFVYGLSVAYSLVEAGLPRVLLCVGDVASRFVDPRDHAIAPIMGDAGAAILVERRASDSVFQLYSDGSGARALMIPNSGMRDVPEDAGKPALMHMDGPAVFNFTLQRVPAMVTDMLACSGHGIDDIDLFVLHQPNKYILRNLQKRLKIPEERIPMATQSVYGNQNAASIPGTISGFLSARYGGGKVRSLFAGFGIGLSWGACVVETDGIFAPPPIIGLKGQ